MRASRQGLLLLVALSSAGCASRAYEPPAEVTIQFGDLNLGSDDGRTQLRKRIDAAATALCEFEADARGLPREFDLAHPERCLMPARVRMMRTLPHDIYGSLRRVKQNR